MKKKSQPKEREVNKAYIRNFWKTAKDVTNGTFGQAEKTPTYNKSTADKHYSKTYETHEEIDFNKLGWFPDVEPPKLAYNMNPFKPIDIRKALSKKNKTWSSI